MVNRKAERKNMNKLNELLNQANLELDKIMPEFLGKLQKVKELLEKNGKDSPIVIDSEADKLYCECYHMWLDMALAYPLIKFRDPKMFYDTNDLLFGEQPPMEEVKELTRKAVKALKE